MAAKRPGGNKSAIVDAALDRFLNPERDQFGDAALMRRLDRLTRQVGRVERDLAITAETLALFVRYYLTITPPLPGADQNAARALGRERFETFVTQVGRSIATGGRLVAEVMDKIVAANPDAFAQGNGPASQSFDRDPPANADADGTPEPSPAGRGEAGHV
jgi:hypothetical protein